MTTTTEEYWSVIPDDGVEYALNTLAYNIESWGNERQGVVPFRGEDTLIPWRTGRQETERVADSRTMPLGMWVRGTTPSGEIPDGSSMRSEFNANWNTLKRILHNRGKVFTLRKRFYDESRTLRVADARVRYADGLDPAMLGRTGAKFTVDLFMADPYFYGNPIDIPVDSTMVNSAVTILGDADCVRMTFNGTSDLLVATSDVTISSEESTHQFGFVKSMDIGSTILFDFEDEIARVSDVNFSGVVTHSGSVHWFKLVPGVNHLTCSANSGSWSGILTYNPTWN